MPIVIALAVILIAVAGIAPSSWAQDVVKLAIVAEITGGGAPSGTMWRDGVILAVEDINRTGGMRGRRVEAFVKNGKPEVIKVLPLLGGPYTKRACR